MLRRPGVVAAVVLGLVSATCTSQGSPEPVLRPSLVGGTLGFSDVAEDVGLRFRHSAFRWDVSPDAGAMLGGGVCWLDYDDDGWLDLYVVNSYSEAEAGRWEAAGGLPRNALFHNTGGRFADVSAESGADLAVRGNGCVAADFDLDGRTDLYVTTTQAGALLWNDGDGTFTEAAEEAGVQAFGWYAGAAVGDVNGDTWPDLFLAGYANPNASISGATQGFPNTNLGVRDLLYLSNGPGEDGEVTFREVGVAAGLEAVNFEYGLGAVLSDLDRDDDLDVYVANDTKPNRLYDNVPWPGGADADPAGLGFRFEELGGRAGAADPNAGMGIADGDFDGDGLPDLFVTNARGQVHAVYRGTRSEQVDPAFVDARGELGPDLGAATGWGVTWADLDLDTDLDLVIGNGDIPVTDLSGNREPVQVLRNLTAQGENGRFEDVSDETLSGVGSLLARGSAAGDYDNDGDLDVAINSIGGSLVLLENGGPLANWLEVRPERVASGTAVTVVLPDGRELARESLTGSSYLSSEDPRFHFGLGTAAEVEEVRIRWAGGDETVLTDVAANQIIDVEPPG